MLKVYNSNLLHLKNNNIVIHMSAFWGILLGSFLHQVRRRKIRARGKATRVLMFYWIPIELYGIRGREGFRVVSIRKSMHCRLYALWRVMFEFLVSLFSRCIIVCLCHRILKPIFVFKILLISTIKRNVCWPLGIVNIELFTTPTNIMYYTLISFKIATCIIIRLS